MRPAVAEWLGKLQAQVPDLTLRHLAEPARLPLDVRTLMRGWAEESLHFFTVMVLGYDLLGGEGSFHWEMCRWLEDARRPQLLLCYRGGYKSTVGTISYPIWRAAKDPEEYSHLELVSDANLGKAMMNNLRSRVTKRAPMLQALFPGMVPANKGNERQWSGEVASLATRTGDGPTWEVRTMGMGRAGRHPTTVGMDDITNEVNYGSRSVQDDLKRQLDFIWPLLTGHDDGDPVEIIVGKGTRYNDFDFWGYMIEHLYPDQLDLWAVPVRGTCALDAEGNVTWTDSPVYAHPEQWNDEKLDAMRRKIRDPHVFHCQMFLDTSQSGDKLIPQDWVKYTGMGELPEHVTYFMACDPASGKGESNPAIVVVAIDQERTIHVVHADDSFQSEADFIEGIFALYRQFLPSVVAVEAYAQAGKSMQEQLAARCLHENEWLPVEYVTHGHLDKATHIRRAIQPPYQWGKVRHLITLRQTEFETQLFSFPHGKMLDMLDALAYAVGIAQKYGPDYVPAPGDARNRVVASRDFPVAYSLETLLSVADLPEDEEHEHAGVW